MNTHKISCPHCQQHIEYDARYAGMTIPCPSCQGEMVVPAAMKLSSAHPTTSPTASSHGRGQRRGGRFSLIILASIFVAALLLAAIILKPVISRSWAELKADQRAAEVQTHASADAARSTAWTMDPEAAEIPDHPATGSMIGTPFQVGRASLIIGGPAPVLSLRSGVDTPYREFLVQLPRGSGSSLDEQSWTVTPVDSASAVKVFERWEAATGVQQKTFDSQFVLKLELGRSSGGVLPGKLFLALPDAERSFVAGRFRANLQVVSQTTSSSTPPGSAVGSSAQPAPPKRGPASVILKQRAREFGEDRDE